MLNWPERFRLVGICRTVPVFGILQVGLLGHLVTGRLRLARKLKILGMPAAGVSRRYSV
jgi:hypothetical protein